MRLVAALGGNALGPDAARSACVALARAVADGHEVVVTHGNGPQVGRLLLDQEGVRGPGRRGPDPLSRLVAMTQGWLGAPLQRALSDALRAVGRPEGAVALVTHVEVDPRDPAFGAPTKPVGPHLDAVPDAEHAYARTARGTWRRVVASPLPRRVVEVGAVRRLLEAGITPVALGGGGIPVVPNGDTFEPVDGVVDKDHGSARLALDLDADLLLLLTDVAGVQADFGTPEQRTIRTLDVADARAMVADGTLPPGSMGPKVEAAAAVVAAGGRAVIGAITDVGGCLAGRSGTTLVDGTAA